MNGDLEQSIDIISRGHILVRKYTSYVENYFTYTAYVYKRVHVSERHASMHAMMRPYQNGGPQEGVAAVVDRAPLEPVPYIPPCICFKAPT